MNTTKRGRYMITITTGASRRSTAWKSVSMEWSELAERFGKFVESSETLEEFKKLPKTERDDLKDIGGFVGGTLNGSRRTNNAIVTRSLITLDADCIAANGDTAICDAVDALGVNAVVYSTRNHSAKSPRLRIVVPLDEPCTPDQYSPIARQIAHMIDPTMQIYDKTTFDVARMMYWASRCKDAEFVYHVSEGEFLDKSHALGLYKDWTDVAEWATVPDEDAPIRASIGRRKHPSEAPGMIGSFCSVYDIHTAIDEFLPDVYEEVGSDRYSYAGAATTAGAIVYDDGAFLYSNHASDPACGELCNAFDLVRIHKFGELDADKPDATPANRPSMKAMYELVQSIPEVRLEKATSTFKDRIKRREEVQSLTAKSEPAPLDIGDKEWFKLLKLNDKTGDIEDSSSNIKLILKNDKALAGKVFLDEMTGRIAVSEKLPWDSGRLGEEKRSWDDYDDSCLRNYLDDIYGIRNPRVIADSFSEYVNHNRRNLLVEWLDSLEWDGTPRVDSLLVDFFGVEDNIYTRLAMRRTLVGAVARAIEPGCKHDTMLVISGAQGIGKSQFWAKLGKEYFSDSLYSMNDKAASEQIQGKWIVESGELSGMRKSEENDVKAFLSKQVDTYRPAYGKRVIDQPRRCILVGTTNESNFLRDATGSRRFWPVDAPAEAETEYKVMEDLDDMVEQIWAEAAHLYANGEIHYIPEDSEAGKLAFMNQESHAEESTKVGVIKEFLDKKITKDWRQQKIDYKIAIMRGIMDVDESQFTESRMFISAAEIWVECFNKDLGSMRRTDTLEINGILNKMPEWKKASTPKGAGLGYGKQRGFERLRI